LSSGQVKLLLRALHMLCTQVESLLNLLGRLLRPTRRKVVITMLGTLLSVAFAVALTDVYDEKITGHRLWKVVAQFLQEKTPPPAAPPPTGMAIGPSAPPPSVEGFDLPSTAVDEETLLTEVNARLLAAAQLGPERGGPAAARLLGELKSLAAAGDEAAAGLLAYAHAAAALHVRPQPGLAQRLLQPDSAARSAAQTRGGRIAAFLLDCYRLQQAPRAQRGERTRALRRHPLWRALAMRPVLLQAGARLVTPQSLARTATDRAARSPAPDAAAAAAAQGS
jgi:hypothetical protein